MPTLLNQQSSVSLRLRDAAAAFTLTAPQNLVQQWRGHRVWIGWIACLLILAGGLGYVEESGWSRAENTASMYVGSPTTDNHGVAYYPVRSAYQGYREQMIRVLRPTHPLPGVEPSTVYVLPVAPGVNTLSSKWSDGLEQLRLLDVPNRFNMTLIAPSFQYIPWYADHPRDPCRRMESFLIRDLVPFGDTLGPSGHIRHRYIIGFSKSGYGAFTLILRHPDLFQAAAAWDFPAELDNISAFPDLSGNFADQENFSEYEIPALITANAAEFQHENRLWISGDQGIFTHDMTKLHRQLTALSIPHTWVQGGYRRHDWSSGWLEGAVEYLAANSASETPAGALFAERNANHQRQRAGHE
ncbi:MAG TPA: alpha/beta hydrolase-fold protein [Candidatus Sulfotelmatobacter sp.]|nr:alpha/beta hydrolase-fold protein [Candidatus Sulfotelmatobacter sp.]